MPAKLTSLANGLPPRSLAVGDYRGLLLEFSSLLEEREVWLGTMLHHIKNDLQAVILGLNQLRDTPGDLERVLPDVDKATGRLQSKLNNVATYQWTQFGAPEQAGLIDLGSLVETIVDDIVDAGGDAAFAADDDVYVVARKEALESALQNLVWNAHHHGGAVEVGIRIGEEAKTVEITIDDDGPGIPENAMEDVFKPYRKVGRTEPVDQNRLRGSRAGFVDRAPRHIGSRRKNLHREPEGAGGRNSRAARSGGFAAETDRRRPRPAFERSSAASAGNRRSGSARFRAAAFVLVVATREFGRFVPVRMAVEPRRGAIEVLGCGTKHGETGEADVR